MSDVLHALLGHFIHFCPTLTFWILLLTLNIFPLIICEYILPNNGSSCNAVVVNIWPLCITVLKLFWFRLEQIQIQMGSLWLWATGQSVQFPTFPQHWTSRPTGQKPCHSPHQMKEWKMSLMSSRPASSLSTLLVNLHEQIRYINPTIKVCECRLRNYSKIMCISYGLEYMGTGTGTGIN